TQINSSSFKNAVMVVLQFGSFRERIDTCQAFAVLVRDVNGFTHQLGSPGNARFLTPEERRFTIDRLKPEGGVDEENRSVIKSQAKSAFFDHRVYVYILAATFGAIPFNALNYFLPTLVGQLGYNPVETQLMSVPPYIIATIVMIIFSWLADKYQVRALPIMVGDIVAIIGIAGTIATSATDPTLLMKFHLNYENKKRDLATLSNNKIQLSESELKDTKSIKEKAAKLVEHEPKFDDILCDLHPNW
ncbi:14111_t:CDS:2, partial [Racocetra fulgida]